MKVAMPFNDSNKVVLLDKSMIKTVKAVMDKSGFYDGDLFTDDEKYEEIIEVELVDSRYYPLNGWLIIDDDFEEQYFFNSRRVKVGCGLTKWDNFFKYEDEFTVPFYEFNIPHWLSLY